MPGTITDVVNPSGNVAVVDDYAPTRRLAPAFRDLGYNCVRVQSTGDIPAIFRRGFAAEDYVAAVVHRGAVEDTLRELRAHRPVAVVAGTEPGVELADALSEGLGLASNGTASSAARRDKFLMVEAVRAAGLRAAAQIRAGSAEELADWHRRIGGRIVVKPDRSSAGDGVRFCETAAEAVTAYHWLLGRRNIFDEPNGSVVAQEYLVGGEYIVNTVSRAGRHHVCDLWRTIRVDVNGELDSLAGVYVLPREGIVQDQLVSYAYQVLDAVGILHGPAHIEIKLTPAGPCLVEVGARVGGSDNPYYAERATGESQVTWTVDAYVRPDRFDARYRENYRIRRFFASMVMLCPREGILRSYPYLGEVERLESLHDIRIMIHPGEAIPRSVGGSRHPMIVNLEHPVEGVLMRDVQTLLYLDGHTFYDVE